MSKMTKRAFRAYASLVFPDTEREEPFLNEKSQIGWHLTKTNFFCYSFQKGEPADYQYRMEFIGKKRAHEAYMQLIEDLGWEIVDTRRDELGVWVYCRKLCSSEDTLELYTDQESKLELIRRIKKAYWRLGGLCLVVSSVFIVLLFVDWIPMLIGGLVGGVIGGLIGYIEICRKMKRLKDSKH